MFYYYVLYDIEEKVYIYYIKIFNYKYLLEINIWVWKFLIKYEYEKILNDLIY